MKLLFFIMLPLYLSAQKTNLTQEDALNRLFNNPDFVNDIVQLSSNELNAEKLNSYLNKYVPEFGNNTISGSTLDFNRLYFANSSNASPEQLTNKLTTLLKLNPSQVQHISNTLSGNFQFTPISGLSSGLANSLYERGKNAKVDYAVDYAVDFFQNEFGDGGLKSTLIDVGGGILGGLALVINKHYEEKKAIQAIKIEAIRDYNIYRMGETSMEENKGAEDLLVHNKADNMTDKNVSLGIRVDFESAIPLFSEAIIKYSQKPERAYYLYHAYVSRARSKMQLGAYKASIIDYYFAQVTLDNILNGNLPDKSISANYPAGYFSNPNKRDAKKISYTVGSITKIDKVILLLARGYAKYRSNDYSGAIADCTEADQVMSSLGTLKFINSYSLKDILQSVKAMSIFRQGNYPLAYSTFKVTNTYNLISDNDNDSNLDLFDKDQAGQLNILDEAEGLNYIHLYSLPEYCPFDILQIRGLSEYKVGEIDSAIKLYEGIVETENVQTQFGGTAKKLFTMTGGDISSVYATLGNFYLAQGNKEKALDMMNNAISIRPDQLEYYASRANCKNVLGDKNGSEADWAIVKDPARLNVRKKSEKYYETKWAELYASNNYSAKYDLMKEAVAIYPKNDFFFNQLVVLSIKETDLDKIISTTEVVGNNKKRYHVLKGIYYQKAENVSAEEQEFTKAFENGLGFYEASQLHLDLFSRPYYCKLLMKYATEKNNSFIPKDFNKENVVKELDSIYNNLPSYHNAKGIFKKSLEQSRAREYAKNLGEIEKYYKLLIQEKMLLEMSPILLFHVIECLFILNRDEEAVKVAKKLLAAGKMKKEDVSRGDYAETNNRYLEGVQYIASGCK